MATAESFLEVLADTLGTLVVALRHQAQKELALRKAGDLVGQLMSDIGPEATRTVEIDISVEPGPFGGGKPVKPIFSQQLLNAGTVEILRGIGVLAQSAIDHLNANTQTSADNKTSGAQSTSASATVSATGS